MGLGTGIHAAEQRAGQRPPAECASIDDVIARMRAINAELGPSDGVFHFNRLYLQVTEEVLASLGGHAFESAAFMTRIDVVFANLYLRAYDRAQAGERPPAAWMPLFEARTRGGRVPLQFALAGMNAHINHDLPLAVVATCAELGLTPQDDTPEHRDFQRANSVLRDVEARIKSTFVSGLLAVLDRKLGQLDDEFCMDAIHLARDAAWAHAKRLWELSDHPRLCARRISTCSPRWSTWRDTQRSSELISNHPGGREAAGIPGRSDDGRTPFDPGRDGKDPGRL